MKTIPNPEFYAIARKYLATLSRKRPDGVVSVDDAERYLTKKGLQPKHPNLWGSVFRTGEWEEVRCEKSSRPSRRGGRRCDWRLSGGAA